MSLRCHFWVREDKLYAIFTIKITSWNVELSYESVNLMGNPHTARQIGRICGPKIVKPLY